jgi:hypothetical protein
MGATLITFGSSRRSAHIQMIKKTAVCDQTYCSKLVRSSQATPTETVNRAPHNKMETR